ncbi:MAG: type III-A CRISPR-associated RAMP protein Csm5 [Bacteroidia bacterium]|nr:type III-A CRISPR-associated RAMP protein Csm5 [Bacteroidia bacterium]
MKVFLRTLTPLHIGTGENLHSLDYVLKDGYYYRVSQAQFTRFLGGLPNKEEMVERFVEWISQLTDRLENLEFQFKTSRDNREKRDYNQQLRDLRDQLRLEVFCEKQKLSGGFIAFLNDPKNGVRKYKLNGNTKQQVRGLITTATNELYLPGSTLKGSIRTALMYQVMTQELLHNKRAHKDALLKDIQRCLDDRTMRPMELRKKMGRELEYSIAFCGMLDRRKERVFDDEKMDLFKFLEVSDAVYVSGERPVEVVASDLYLVARSGGRFGAADRNAPKVALRQPQSPGLEAIRRGVVFKTEIAVNVAAMYAIYTKLPEPGKREHWIRFEEKVKSLYGIDIILVNQTNIEEHQAKADAYVFQALQNFATAQAKFDKEQWLEKQMLTMTPDRGMPDKKTFRKPFDEIYSYPHNGRTLLRTGFATGFAGKTELLPMLLDDELRAAFRKVMNRLELGKRPGVRDAKPYDANIETFPKSRLLITYPDNTVQPLGWMEYIPESEWSTHAVEVHEPATSVPEAPEAAHEPIKPQYMQQKARKGSILDAYVYPIPGPTKKIKVYLNEGNETDLTISYRADTILEQVILVEVVSMAGEKVTGVRFKGMKMANR